MIRQPVANYNKIFTIVKNIGLFLVFMYLCEVCLLSLAGITYSLIAGTIKSNSAIGIPVFLIMMVVVYLVIFSAISNVWQGFMNNYRIEIVNVMMGLIIGSVLVVVMAKIVL